MEGAGHRGRWSRKHPGGTLLLLMCMFIPTFTLLQEKKECKPGEYPTEEGICCNKCPPGFKLTEKCHNQFHRSNCTECPQGEYTAETNWQPTCSRCKRCKTRKHEVVDSPCEIYKNTICRCEDGFYKHVIDQETYECLRCKQCGADEVEKHKCTPTQNTECGCKENYYRVKKQCEPCKNCMAECKHHCSSLPSANTKAPEDGSSHLINVIVGVAAGGCLLLVVGVLVTFVVTKRFTKKQLSPPPSPSDVSVESCKEILIRSEEPSEDFSVKAVAYSPVSEQVLSSNLPDCVPLEIKIPDLIYTVLDQVPVKQVKQLVRLLGVTDTEIEQAEKDHLSCREAHYQMLRVWVERGSPAGGGGRGGFLHWPLLQELLDKLRIMHLGRAAEELEAKYSIQ